MDPRQNDRIQKHVQQRQRTMKTLVIFIFGFVVGSIGLTGTINLVNNGLDRVQAVSKEAAK
jgi:hypothetical protein